MLNKPAEVLAAVPAALLGWPPKMGPKVADSGLPPTAMLAVAGSSGLFAVTVAPVPDCGMMLGCLLACAALDAAAKLVAARPCAAAAEAAQETWPAAAGSEDVNAAVWLLVTAGALGAIALPVLTAVADAVLGLEDCSAAAAGESIAAELAKFGPACMASAGLLGCGAADPVLPSAARRVMDLGTLLGIKASGCAVAFSACQSQHVTPTFRAVAHHSVHRAACPTLARCTSEYTQS